MSRKCTPTLRLDRTLPAPTRLQIRIPVLTCAGGGSSKSESFHELHTEAEQRAVLSEIARLLKPNGRFVCTLHNPKVRFQSVGRGAKSYGPFPRTDGTGSVALSVDLDYELETRTGTAWQIVYELDSAGQEVAEHRLQIRFSLIEFDVFQELAQSAGFVIEELFGNYDRSPFVPETSPYIIVRARKVDT